MNSFRWAVSCIVVIACIAPTRTDHPEQLGEMVLAYRGASSPRGSNSSPTGTSNALQPTVVPNSSFSAIRISDVAGRASANYTQGFRLPPMEGLKIPESLILPLSLAQKGRGIDIYHPDHGSAKQVMPGNFLERGADFDRVTIA